MLRSLQIPAHEAGILPGSRSRTPGSLASRRAVDFSFVDKLTDPRIFDTAGIEEANFKRIIFWLVASNMFYFP